MQLSDRIQKTMHKPVSNTHSSFQSKCVQKNSSTWKKHLPIEKIGRFSENMPNWEKKILSPKNIDRDGIRHHTLVVPKRKCLSSLNTSPNDTWIWLDSSHYHLVPVVSDTTKKTRVDRNKLALASLIRLQLLTSFVSVGVFCYDQIGMGCYICMRFWFPGCKVHEVRFLHPQ